MIRTLFRRLSLLTLILILSGAGFASAAEEQIYTIKKGDTLWDLSQKFIDDPYYWPNVWAKNPDITNPHLIFPGQKIRILDGRLEIIPAYSEAKKEGESVTISSTGQVNAPTESVTIKSAGSGDGFILTSEKPLGMVVDSVDNRILLTENDLVFVKVRDISAVKVGDTYGLFERGDVVKHPHTNEPIGTMMHNLGSVKVTEINGDTVIAKINKVFREITRGAELYEYQPLVKEITLQRGPADLKGSVIANRDEKGTISTNDVIFVDLGTDDGLASGNLLYISQPRKVSDEIIQYTGHIDLPDAVLGAAVVIEAKAKTASAIVIKSVDASFIGDNVSVVAE